MPVRDHAQERLKKVEIAEVIKDHRLQGNPVFVSGQRFLELQNAFQEFKKTGNAWTGLERSETAVVRIDLASKNPTVVLAGLGKEVSFEEAWDAYRRGSRSLFLGGAGTLQLPAEWMESWGPQIEDLLSRLKDGANPKLLQFELGSLEGSIEWKGPRPKKLALEENPPCPPQVESNLWDTLRSYQRQGVSWMNTRLLEGLGVLLADDMGLGKTLQSMALLEAPALVIAPTSVLWNWKEELARFRPSLRVNVYHGSGRKLGAESDIVLTSYGLVRQESETFASQELKL